MIKTAIKHWIYELCINRLFSSIETNFINKNKIKHNFTGVKAGDRFKFIECLNGKDCNVRFHNCIVVSIEENLMAISYKEHWLLGINKTGKKQVFDSSSRVFGIIVINLLDIVDYEI
jgi:hypothetical protein